MTEAGAGVLRARIHERIAEAVGYVANNPAVFVSETDIHVLMIRELMKIDVLQRLYETAATIGRNRSGVASLQRYKTLLVHKEYGHNDIGWARSDIVIFDESDARTIDDPVNLTSHGHYVVPRYILEFGTEKAAGSSALLEQHMTDDMAKADKAKDAGYLIHVHRWHAGSPAYSARYDNHVDRRKDFESVVEAVWNKHKKATNVNPVVLFINMGVPGRVLRNRITLFNPSACKFWPVPLGKIAGNVLAILNGSPARKPATVDEG